VQKIDHPTGRRLRRILIGLALLFLAVLAAGVYSTISQTNEVEKHRNIRLVGVAVNSERDGLESVANDNAYWDEAADEFYGGADPKAYFHITWTPYTTDEAAYFLAFATDSSGKLIAAGEDSVPASFDPHERFGTAFAKQLSTLSDASPTVSGLVKDKDGIVFMASSRVRYIDAPKNAQIAKTGYANLTFVRQLDAELLQGIGEKLDIKGLRLVGKAKSESMFALSDPNGKTLSHLTWSPPQSGFVAAQEALPVLMLGTLLFFAVLAVAGRTGRSMIDGLHAQAMTDSVSNLPNRRAIRRALGDLQIAQRPHALALIDLDGFKAVNDSFGHAVGDLLIKKVAMVIAEETGKDGIVARLGGDEFAVLVSGKYVNRRIKAFAEALLARLQQPIMVEDRSLTIGASIGLSATAKPFSDEGEMLRRADVAMYQAKRLGKMRAEWFNPKLDEAQTLANHLAGELRISLSRDDLDVVYQPIVSAESGDWVAVEALARWTSPTRGPIGPDVFVPIAEDSGLIDAVGLFVLRRACADLQQWTDLDLAVNVSAAQLRNPAFPLKLQAILEETGFAPHRLQLEITETYLIADAVLARKVIDGVAALGVMISLDDFGTGYASVGFLRQFSFGKLKIDRGLVAESLNDPGARVLLQVSVAAARALDMIVTAEGVESAEVADLMRVIGCDELQGWHFGHPAPLATLHAALPAEPGFSLPLAAAGHSRAA
jgi:diguanylate cyclase (GGDEF)-like protein